MVIIYISTVNDSFSLTDVDVFNYPSHVGKLLFQEKLSNHLDIVEMELIKQISARSDAIYVAMGHLQQLHRIVESTVYAVAEARLATSHLRQSMIEHRARVAQKYRRHQNMIKIYRKLSLMATVRKTQTSIQLLLSSSDFSSALDLIQTTQYVLRTELSGVVGFKHLSLQLDEMVVLIEKMSTMDFLHASVDTSEMRGVVISQADLDDITDQLIPLVMSLVRLNKMHSAIQSYRELVMEQVDKLCQDGYDMAIQDLAANDPQGHLAQTVQNSNSRSVIQALSPLEFIRVMQLIFDFVLPLLTRTSVVFKVIMQALRSFKELNEQPADSAESVANHPATVQRSNSKKELAVNDRNEFAESQFRLNPESIFEMESSLQDVYTTVFEVAHQKCAEFVMERHELNTKLHLQDFVQLNKTANRFIADSERCYYGQIQGLRSILSFQAKGFLEEHHKKKINALNMLLENEMWSQAEVPPQFQETLASWSPHASSPETSESSNSSSTSTTSSSSSNNTEKNSKVVRVEGHNFKVVGSLLMLAQILDGYLEIVENLPTLATDVSKRMVELIKLFNARSCQLVLGAGAMQLAGLKSITAKHLSLVSQCLSLLILEIPNLKDSLALHIPPKHHIFLQEFDRAKQDCSHHCSQIFAKLIAIMRDRVEYYGKAIQGSTDWSQHRDEPGEAVKSLMNETQVMNKVMSKMLQANQLADVFGQMVDMIDAKLLSLYEQVQTTDVTAFTVPMEVGFVLSCLKSLKGVDYTGEILIDLCKRRFGVDLK